MIFPGPQVLELSEEKLSHKGLKKFKGVFFHKSYSSAMETLDVECFNHWKFTNIQKTPNQTPKQSTGKINTRVVKS